MARLNRAPAGTAVQLTPALFSALVGAQACAQRTDGAFDPAIGPLVAAWDLRGSGRVPTKSELRRALRLSGNGAFHLTENGTATRMWPEAWIEEGGFGKGEALDEAFAAVQNQVGVHGILIDLGGQVGARSAGAPWLIELAHPGERERTVASLHLQDGSIATSGNSERGIRIDGVRYGHVLDPRSGRPAEDFGSLAVLAPTGLDADCLSTGLYVLGPNAALAWALRHPGVEVAVLEPRGDGLRIRATPGLVDRIETVGDGAVLTQITDPGFLGLDSQTDATLAAAGRRAGRVR